MAGAVHTLGSSGRCTGGWDVRHVGMVRLKGPANECGETTRFILKLTKPLTTSPLIPDPEASRLFGVA